MPRAVRQAWVCLAIVVTGAIPAAAQGGAGTTYRLTVRPREMATAIRTERSGDLVLDAPLKSATDYLVHVPQQCVGAQRCPLLVFVGGAGQTADFMMKWQRIISDKHGIIVLTISTEKAEPPNVDAAMKQVLQKYAIDPDKIALLGRCAGTVPALSIGGNNLDVFSRILPISGVGLSSADVGPPNETAEFFIGGGLWESDGNFKLAQELRQAGHPVKLVVALRLHGDNLDDYQVVGRWLAESWAIPNPAARPTPRVLPGPTPLLTTDIVGKMAAFWTRFMKEPDSILFTARWAHQQEVAVSVGRDQASVTMMDMPSLAARQRSVAAALTAAGLTAAQHDAYRVALLSAVLMDAAGSVVDAAADTSAMAQNVTFVQEHREALAMLAQAGVQQPNAIGGYGIDIPFLASADVMEHARKYAQGIWYMP